MWERVYDPPFIFDTTFTERMSFMKNNRGQIASTVWKIAEPLVTSMGYSLWDVEYVKEGADMYLRITIDSEEGINIDDCEKVHRAIDPLLDEADPIEESYHLEISSPGIERDLHTDAQIEACIGWDVELRLFAPIDGAKSFSGQLLGKDPETKEIVLTINGIEKRFPEAAVASLKTTYDFSADERN